MADRNTTGAVHLASIDLDISAFHKNIEEIKKQIDEVSKYVNDTKFQFGGTNSTGNKQSAGVGESIAKEFERATQSVQEFGNATNSIFSNLKTGNVDWLRGIGISEENISSAQNKIRELSKEIENASSIQITTKEGNLFQAIVKYSDEAGNSMREVIDLTKELGEAQSKITITDDFEKRNKAIAKEQEARQKALDKQIEEEEKQRKRQEEAAWKEYEAFQEAEAKKNSEIAKGVEKRNAERAKEEAAAEKLAQSEAKFIAETEKSQQTAIKQLETLGSAYTKLSEQVKLSNISTEKKDYFSSGIEKAKLQIEELKSDLSQGFFDESVAKKAEQGISRLSNALEKANSEFSSAKLEAKEFGSVSNDIEKVTSKLNTLEKTSINKGIKREATELKFQFQDLYNQIQSGTVSVEDAKARFNALGNAFDDLNIKAKHATGGIEGMLLKLADRAKIMVSYQAIGLVQNALGQVVSTIQTTEDAVVDLQRVLNEAVSFNTISDELYKIAYDFGQTFENVQEVAVRFAQTGMGWQETIDATRATMLGLNTAELEVSTATEGLIATMSQFKIDASELEGVIDKINITADNFPVTSEKIVAALQRAGGTASAFNMSLEETIATITTLSKETGRSGENIGTALNSLIIYTSKADSLELFSGLSEQMDEVVKKYQAGAASILDVWTQLGFEVNKLSDAQAKALFNSDAYQEFADSFESEATEYANAIQEVYDTAGTYRRNYLTALLQDIEEVEDVMSKMADAEGYSQEENKKYMETLTAAWNDLVIVAKELAVQFGNEGFLSFLKFLTTASTGALQLLKDIGGLNTVIIALATALFKVKQQKIVDSIIKIPTHIKNIGSSLGGLVSQLNIVKVAQDAYNKSLSEQELSAQKAGASLDIVKAKSAATATAVVTSITSVMSVLSILTTVIFAAVNAWNSYQESVRKAREESLQSGSSAAEEANNIYELYSEYLSAKKAYDETSGSSERLRNASDALLTALGDEGKSVRELSGGYGELGEEIKKVTLINLEKKLLAQGEALETAKKQVQELYEIYNGVDTFTTTVKVGEDGTARYEAFKPKDMKEFLKDRERLKEIQDEIILNNGAEAASQDELYQMIEKTTQGEQEYINILKEKEDEYENTQTQIEAIRNGTVELSQAVDENGNVIANAGDSVVDFTKELEELANAFDEVSGQVDSFQSAYSSVLDVINEYNETGIMTADMLQQLLQLEPEYLAMLDVKADSLGLNESAVNGLINANDVYLQQMIALKAAEEADAMATQMAAAANAGLTYSEYEAAYAGQTLQANLQAAIIAEINGTGTSYDLANAIRAVGESAGLSGQYLNAFTNSINNYVGTLSSLYGKVNRGSLGTYYTPSISTGRKKGSSGGGGSGSNANSAQRKALQNEIKAWQKQKEATKDYYDSLIDNEKKQQEAQKKYYDSLIDNLKKQQEESDKYYEKLISDLKEVEEANERINAQIDYYNNRQKLLRNIEQAQSRSGVEWREKEVDYQQQLIDLDEDWRRTLEGWSIDDQIKELERIKEQARGLIDAQIEELERIKEKQIELIELQIEEFKKIKEAAIDEIEAIIDKLQEKISALSSSTGKSVASGIGSGISSAGNQFNAFANDVGTKTADLMKNVGAMASKAATSALDGWKNQYVEPAVAGVDMLKKAIEGTGDSAKKAAISTGEYWQKSFTNPAISGINTLIYRMNNDMVKGSAASADSIMAQYKNRFINPLGISLNNVLRKAQMDAQSALAGIQMAYFGHKTSSAPKTSNVNNTVNFNANISNTSSANNAIKGINNFFTNPSKR